MKIDRTMKAPTWHELKADAELLAAQADRKAAPGSGATLESVLQELMVSHLELQIQNLELQRTQDALEASREEYFELFHAAPVGYAVADAGGYVLDANAALGRMLGLGTAGAARRNLASFFPRGEQDLFTLHWKQLGQTGMERAFQAHLLDRRGSQFWALVHLAPACPVLGASRYRLAVVDLSTTLGPGPERDKERAARAQGRRLEGLCRLAQGTAHAVYHVLATIAARAASEPSGGQAAILAQCDWGKARILSLAHFVLERAVDGEALDLGALVRSELAFLEGAGGMVRTHLDLAPDLQAVRGDAPALGLAILNLVVNALEAMAGAGVLTVRARNEDADGVLLEVADTGPGMGPEVALRAAEPFFSTKAAGEASGLGLTVVLDAVRAHGGRMDIESAPERGTTVRLHLPASPPEDLTRGRTA